MPGRQSLAESRVVVRHKLGQVPINEFSESGNPTKARFREQDAIYKGEPSGVDFGFSPQSFEKGAPFLWKARTISGERSQGIDLNRGHKFVRQADHGIHLVNIAVDVFRRVVVGQKPPDRRPAI
jgi:hypothetical protein